MEIFRAIFTTLLAVFLVYSSGLSAMHLIDGNPPLLSWLGLLLAAAAPLAFIGLRYAPFPALGKTQPLGFSILCGLGLAITMSSSWKHGDAAGDAHLWAGACLVLWFSYLKWSARKQVNAP